MVINGWFFHVTCEQRHSQRISISNSQRMIMKINKKQP